MIGLRTRTPGLERNAPESTPSGKNALANESCNEAKILKTHSMERRASESGSVIETPRARLPWRKEDERCAGR